MAGIHIVSEYESLGDGVGGGHEFTVEIYDKDTVEPPNAAMTISAGVKITYEGNEALVPIFPIMFSHADFNLFVRDDTEEGYLNTIIDGQEDQFYLIVYRDGSVFWRGVILKDQMKLQRSSFPYEVKIRASDGLARLQDVNLEIPSSAGFNFITALNAVLKETLLQNANFDEENEDFLTTACRIYETDMFDAFSTSVDPLRYARANNLPRLYTGTVKDGVRQYKSYMQVLLDICKTFGLCAKQWNGHWYLIQVDAYNETTLRLHNYSLDCAFSIYGTSMSSGTSSLTNYAPAESIANKGEIQANEFYSFAPAMRQARLKVQNLENKVIVPAGYYSNLRALTTLGSVVSGNFNSGARIRLNLTAEVTQSTWPVNFLIEWQIKVKCGSNYLTNQGGNVRWTTTASDFFGVTQIQSNPGTSPAFFTLNGGSGGQWFDIITNSIPSTDDLEIQVDIGFTTLAGNLSSGFTLVDVNGSIAADYFNYVTTEAPDDEVQHLFGMNQDSSFVFDLGETQLADDPDTSFAGKLIISTGAAWQDSQAWGRFDALDTTGLIVDKLLESIYRSQQTTLKILNASIVNIDIELIGTITVDSLKLYLQRGVYNTGQDSWAGSWIQIGSYDGEGGGAASDFYDGIGLTDSSSGQFGGFGKLSPSYKMLNGFLDVTRTAEVLTGTMTDFDVDAVSINVANVDDEIMVFNPYSGDTEVISLSNAWESGATNLEINSHAFSKSFPVGSIVAIPMRGVVSRLFALENP